MFSERLAYTGEVQALNYKNSKIVTYLKPNIFIISLGEGGLFNLKT